MSENNAKDYGQPAVGGDKDPTVSYDEKHGAYKDPAPLQREAPLTNEPSPFNLKQ